MAKATKTEEKAKALGKQKAKEAAEAAARESILSLSSEEDGETHDFLAADKDIAAEITEFSTDDEANRDIFSDIGEERVKKGDIIKYTIFKYGSQLTSVYHPCSWESIHKKFGDGQYKVLARSHSLNRIVKTQSRMLGQPPSEFTMGGVQQEEAKEPVQQQQQNQTPGFMEIFTLFMNQQQQAKAESKEINTFAQQSNNQMMMMFMEMMKSNQQQAVQSQLQTMEMMTKVTEKMSEAQTKMFDKINERIERIANDKAKAPDAETLLDRMQKAQEQGFSLYQKFDELATKKAELQFEMMNDNDDDDDDDDKPEKESITDTLIKTLIPMMAAGQRQMPQTFQQRPQQRGQLPRRTNAPGNPPTNAAGVGRQRATENQNAASSSQGTPTGGGHQQEAVKTSGEVHSQGAVVDVTARKEAEVKMNGALPEVDVTTVQDQETFDFSGKEFGDSGPVLTPRKTAQEELHDTIQDKCREILPGFLGGLMLEGVSSEVGSERTIIFLDEQGIEAVDFIEHVTATDLGEYAKQYSLPEEAYSWLNELYAHIQTTTRADVGGELTPGVEPKFVEGSTG